MPKVLVYAVDDEPLVTRLIQVNLERAGYQVQAAHDGLQALEALRAGAVKPDVIILDVTMPYMNGFELLDQLKADTDMRAIPVIMLTARNRDPDVLHATESGACRYLHKPVHPLELVECVNSVLAETGKSADT